MFCKDVQRRTRVRFAVFVLSLLIMFWVTACDKPKTDMNTPTPPVETPEDTPEDEPVPEPAPTSPEPTEPEPETPEPTEPKVSIIRLMPLGDSITYGAGSTRNNGYRVVLGDLLLEGEPAAAEVDFVGSQDSGRFADPEYVHEGYSGWVIEQLSELVMPTEPNGPLETYTPNLITLHIGTNDMNQDRDVANAPERLETLIDTIFETIPDVILVVATLVPAQDAVLNARIETYNQSVRELVAARRSRSEQIILADMSTVGAEDLADNLHPNNAGYEKMARAFDEAAEEALSLGWLAERAELPDASAVGKWLNGVRSVLRLE